MELLSGLIMAGWGAFLLMKKSVLVEGMVGPLPISGSEDDPYVGSQSYRDYKTMTRVKTIAVGVFLSFLGTLIAVVAFIPR